MSFRTPAPLLVAALVACVTLAGCGTVSVGSTGAPRTAASRAATTHSEAPTATATPTVTETATVTATPSTSPVVPLRSPLLSAAELPGFNAAFRWREARTVDRELKALTGTCQRFPLTSIGALRVVARSFVPAGPKAQVRAGEVVAQFADPATARRAFAVLQAWRGRCGDRLAGYRRHRIGPQEGVSVAGGKASWYLLTYGPVPGAGPDAAWFDAQGMTLVGRRIATLGMAAVGQDYNYPHGREPMVRALRLAARHLA